MVLKKEFEDIKSMVIDVLTNIESNNGISFITKYDNATLILKYIFKYGNFDINHVELTSPDWDCYDREFIISVYDGEVFCERFFKDDRYLLPNDGIDFVLPDCTDECTKHIYSKDYSCMFFVKVNFDESDDDEAFGDKDIVHKICNHIINKYFSDDVMNGDDGIDKGYWFTSCLDD